MQIKINSNKYSNNLSLET